MERRKVGGRDASIINDWLYSAGKLHFARAFCCVLGSRQRATHIEPERIISLDCAYTLSPTFLSELFFHFLFFSLPFFFTSILFKYLKLNEFALSKCRQQKADTGFIIPFLSVLFDDSFSICFLRITKRAIKFKRLG